MKDIDIVQNRSNRDLSGCSHLETENVTQMLPAWIFRKSQLEEVNETMCLQNKATIFILSQHFMGSVEMHEPTIGFYSS